MHAKVSDLVFGRVCVYRDVILWWPDWLVWQQAKWFKYVRVVCVTIFFMLP